jgi:hypothetical protein
MNDLKGSKGKENDRNVTFRCSFIGCFFWDNRERVFMFDYDKKTTNIKTHGNTLGPLVQATAAGHPEGTEPKPGWDTMSVKRGEIHLISEMIELKVMYVTKRCI